MVSPIELEYQESVNFCNAGDFELALRGFSNIFSKKVELLGDKAIRRTYVLSSWILMGKYYFPPALDALAAVLSEKENRLAQDGTNSEVIADIKAIKFCLNNLDCALQ